MSPRNSFLALALVLGSMLAYGQPETEVSAADPTKAADAKKPETPKEKDFADLIKEAKEIKGLFTLYRTEDKVYLELRPDQLDQVFMLSLTSDSGIGEGGFYAASMMGETPIVFRKRNKNIQIIAKNPRFHAEPGSPMARFVERSFSDSVIGLAKIESKPHPERGSVLIDLGSFLLSDVPMLSHALELRFRIPYRFDGKNTSFRAISAYERNVEIGVEAHYGAERPPVPPVRNPEQPAPATPPPPRNLADIRSMFFQLRYSLSELPQGNYRPRLADDRVGHFHTQIDDFSTDKEHTPALRYINRWHLEKRDPNAALSPPKEPIVFWLENTVPLQYRDAIRDGILMWNAAFERIGFQNAIVVKQQPDDAEWDPADIRYNTIRWFAGTDAGFAQGPSRTNPFTGQIYDADIRFSESMTRFRRQGVLLLQNPATWEQEEQPVEPFRAPWSKLGAHTCDYANFAMREAAFAMDVLATRGIEPDSPEADRLVRDFLKEIAAHEVGHTLGLRHNFRASTIHTFDEAQDPERTSKIGLTGSVMDYIPTNIAVRGARQGEFHQSVLGPYDHWAIEYAYKPITASSPEGELHELRQIASRGTDPLLAYATDEDAGISQDPFDMDPLANRFDLGSDPLRFYAHRVELSQEIFANLENMLEKKGQGYQVLRRSFVSALSQSTSALYLASKYIGGVYHHRDHVGDPNGRLPFQPVPAAKQKEALQLICDRLLAPNAYRFTPQLLNKLNSERFTDFIDWSRMRTRFDVPIHDMVFASQKRVLDRLHHPTVLKRILDSEMKVAEPANILRLGDLFSTLQDAIWAETKGPAASLDINSYRRSLQREHLRKLIGMTLRDSAAPEDARTLSRHGLLKLRAQLEQALASTMPLETRAHLEDSVGRIDEALKPTLQRSAI